MANSPLTPQVRCSSNLSVQPREPPPCWFNFSSQSWRVVIFYDPNMIMPQNMFTNVDLFIRLSISKLRFSVIAPTLTKMALHLLMIFVALNEADKNPRYLHHLSLSFSSGSDTRFISLLWGHQLGRRKSSSKYNFDTMNITRWRQNHIGGCC